MTIPHVTIVAVYRSPSVSIREASGAIEETFNQLNLTYLWAPSM